MIFVILVYSFYYYFVLRKCIENLFHINYYNLNFYILLIGFEMQSIFKVGQKNLFSQNTML